jgi:hypothetical protein
VCSCPPPPVPPLVLKTFLKAKDKIRFIKAFF